MSTQITRYIACHHLFVKVLFSLISVLFLLRFFGPSIQAQSGDVTATVRISICGDFVAEADEDCDNQDLDGASCQSLGFLEGDLACDSACDYDTSDCSGEAQTTPTPTPTPTSTTTADADVSPSPTATTSVTVIPTFDISQTEQEVQATPLLPTTLVPFDVNGDGTITEDELDLSISAWVDEWVVYITNPDEITSVEELRCDVNQDQDCNLIDLSVLLYHIS